MLKFPAKKTGVVGWVGLVQVPVAGPWTGAIACLMALRFQEKTEMMRVCGGLVARRAGRKPDDRVESRMSAGTDVVSPPRFPSPLIKPDVPISGIRLSD